MNYYEWIGNMDAVCVEFPDRQFNGFFMVEGTPVIGWNEYLIAVYLCPQTPVFDFGISVNGWPVVSSRMRAHLERIAPNLVQFLPFRYQRPDGTGQVADCYVAQFLRRVDCLDRLRTEVRTSWELVNERGDFAIRWPIFLSRPLIGDATLFRIQGHCRTIIIREDLKLSIEDAGFLEQRFDLFECVD